VGSFPDALGERADGSGRERSENVQRNSDRLTA